MATQAAAGAAGAGTQPHEVLLTDVQVQSAGAGAGSGEAGGGRPGLRQRLGGQRSGCCNALLLLVAVIAVPITVALLLLWGILGLMFTMYVALLRAAYQLPLCPAAEHFTLPVCVVFVFVLVFALQLLANVGHRGMAGCAWPLPVDWCRVSRWI